jgi:hypothetical protein
MPNEREAYEVISGFLGKYDVAIATVAVMGALCYGGRLMVKAVRDKADDIWFKRNGRGKLERKLVRRVRFI